MELLVFIAVGLAVFGVPLYFWLRGGKERALRQSENRKLFLDGIAALIDPHVETLARQRIQLIEVGRYGVVNTSKWDREIQSFIDKVLFPDLVSKDKVLLPVVYPGLVATDPRYSGLRRQFDPFLREVVEEKAQLRAAAIEADLSFVKDMTPQDFERWCTKVISSIGWKATMTKATGDQGADVIAEKEGNRLVLQCKLYSTPVGNKAVQEAFAAQQHYRANASAVVSNAAFTASATALAATTGVRLLHYTDLNRLNVL